MSLRPSHHQEPSLPTSRENVEPGQVVLTQFTQATAEGESAVALRGRSNSHQTLVQYRTTTW